MLGQNKTQSAPFTSQQALNTPMLNIRDELCVEFGRFRLYSGRLEIDQSSLAFALIKTHKKIISTVSTHTHTHTIASDFDVTPSEFTLASGK